MGEHTLTVPVESTKGSWDTHSSSTGPIPAGPWGQRDHGTGGQQHWEGTLKSHHIPRASNGREVELVTHCTALDLQALEKLCSRCRLSNRAQAGDRYCVRGLCGDVGARESPDSGVSGPLRCAELGLLCPLSIPNLPTTMGISWRLLAPPPPNSSSTSRLLGVAPLFSQEAGVDDFPSCGYIGQGSSGWCLF